MLSELAEVRSEKWEWWNSVLFALFLSPSRPFTICLPGSQALLVLAKYLQVLSQRRVEAPKTLELQQQRLPCGGGHPQLRQGQPGYVQHLHKGSVRQEVYEGWEDHQDGLHCQLWWSPRYLPSAHLPHRQFCLRFLYLPRLFPAARSRSLTGISDSKISRPTLQSNFTLWFIFIFCLILVLTFCLISCLHVRHYV